MKTVHEDNVLKPKDPTIEDSNAWLIYTLTHVEVTDPETGELTSLLTAGISRPLTVTGKLERLPDDHLKHLLPNAPYPCNIKITEVRTFSYGQYEEGGLAFWGAGHAGWFELKPSRKYREIWAVMLQAVELLYFLTDEHVELSKKELGNVDVPSLLKKYAEDPKHGCANIGQAEDILKRHRAFLMEEMKKGSQNIAWSRTRIFKRIKQIKREMKKEDDASLLDQTNLSLHETTQSPALFETPDTQTALLRPAGKGKSSLRPVSATIALKAEGRRHSAMDSPAVDVSMTDVDVMQSLSTKSSATTAPVSIEERNIKRQAAANRRKDRHAKRQKLDDLTQKESIIEVPPEQPVQEGPAEIPLPLKITPTMPAPRVRPRPKKRMTHQVRIIEEALPSYLAGEDGVWRCSFDGCSHTVYGVTEENEESKLLIKEHYKKHALDSQAKLDLIYKEERPYLPVGNLVKRIRELAAARPVAEHGSVMTSGTNGFAGIKTEHKDYPKPIVQAGY